MSLLSSPLLIFSCVLIWACFVIHNIHGFQQNGISDTKHVVVGTTMVSTSLLFSRAIATTATATTLPSRMKTASAAASAFRLSSTVSDVDDSYDDDDDAGSAGGAGSAFGDNDCNDDGNGNYNEPKDQLLMALATKDKLFGDKNSKISTLAKDLAGYAMPLMPSTTPYRLLYTDAPDLLGFQGGPLSELVSISQKVTSSTDMEIILEYKPSQGIANLVSNFMPDITQERLQQIVYMEYTKEPMNKIDVKIKGTKLQGTRFGGNDGLPPLTSPTPIQLPFGSFKVLFHDDDLCIQQTIQGEFLFIYQKRNKYE